MTTVQTRPPATTSAGSTPRFSASGRDLLKRLAACLLGGFVLGLMYNTSEGSSTDFGYVFHQAALKPRMLIFLGIGVVIFVLMTFWSLVRQYVRRPGVRPVLIGFLVVLIAHTVLNWYDPSTYKFNALRQAVSRTANVPTAADLFFNDWLAWALPALAVVLVGACAITRLRVLGYLAALCAVFDAVIAWLAHSDVVRIGGGIDHSLGVYAEVIGLLIMAGAGLTAALSHAEVGDWRGFLARVMDIRPGLPFAVAGLVLGALSYGRNCWYAPSARNLDFSATANAYSGTDVSALAKQYLNWLGWTAFAVIAVLAVAATYLRSRLLGWVTVAASVAAIVITFFSLKSMTDVAARVAPQFGTTWNNLGAGGFTACIAYGLFAAAAVYVVSRNRSKEAANGSRSLPITKALEQARGSANTKALLVVALVIALFYPPILSQYWQDVLVSQVAVYLLLAVGLNVVVGWAGLLDLGYIAFYAVGAYTTAFFTGSLPRKPPSWLHLTPLLTIPFAIVACLIAGVLLGAPTLRLRGDYLAIVTLGFGEIIQRVAVNNPFNLTNGPQGVRPPVPHPTLHIGSFKITWGLDNLPYWYLLLVMLAIVIVLFYRLEGSRIGRAWAAIREDEVAAQASGINTVRLKLLAFAIGASTSGLAGSFYASQIGFFDPLQFDIFTSILIVAYVVFGGMGSLPGAMAGAAVLTWLPEFLKSQVPTDDRQMWVGALVLAMMIFRPAGLLPAKRRKAELQGLDDESSAEVRAVPASEGL